MQASKFRDAGGFTLIEAILSIVILGLAAAAVSGVLFTGFAMLRTQDTHWQAESILRSEAEALLSVPFTQLVSGTRTVATAEGNQTLTWTVGTVDMDGDGVQEQDVKQVEVALGQKQLFFRVSNTQGRTAKP